MSGKTTKSKALSKSKRRVAKPAKPVRNRESVNPIPAIHDASVRAVEILRQLQLWVLNVAAEKMCRSAGMTRDSAIAQKHMRFLQTIYDKWWTIHREIWTGLSDDAMTTFAKARRDAQLTRPVDWGGEYYDSAHVATLRVLCRIFCSVYTEQLNIHSIEPHEADQANEYMDRIGENKLICEVDADSLRREIEMEYSASDNNPAPSEIGLEILKLIAPASLTKKQIEAKLRNGGNSRSGGTLTTELKRLFDARQAYRKGRQGKVEITSRGHVFVTS